ncbi:DUF5753 domain-containing protein [Nocardia otitidiscaviarum]|uniref:DUF5753 domain-containing protein n=1 Tax=Nocardia otitidiscaviarum TaxID=1823 RepID=UPI0018955EC3|nr:DUF5753 domain-containing protein [Nocardia otitidiscaviarum]MBF6182133.1 XRE family transcriptional regulator [Nocardia otitidiscaviarum]
MRLEKGEATKLTTPQIENLLDLYAPPSGDRTRALRLWAEIREHEKLARLQGNSKGFWQPYADQVAPHFPHYLQLEADADHVTTHQLALVPGLLQTSDYRRALARIEEPDLPGADTERRVELATRRQAKLNEPGFTLEVFLSEAVLWNQPGGKPVMREQLEWLLMAGQRDNISIRGIPFGTGSHKGLTIQSFTLLAFPNAPDGPVEPPVVYLEGALGALYHTRADVIDLYRTAIADLDAVALDENGTRDMVSRVAKEFAE